MAVDKDVGMSVKMQTKCFPEIKDLADGKTIDSTHLLALVDFVNKRYDCADFRLICLIKTYVLYRNLLEEHVVKTLKEAILNFKYWMDEPGEDGMCYWSENHQLLFHVCEYLAGQTFPDEIFINDGKTGTEHLEKARPKIIRWLTYKFRYGFIEWHSNTYYEEDIAPLAMLVDHAKDQELIRKSTIILDLMFLDFAMHSYQGYFVATSGRAYEKQKMDVKAHDVNDILMHAFGILNHAPDYSRLSALYLLSSYRVPEIIKKIAVDDSTVVIKDSMGLDLNEVSREIKDGSIDDRGMLLWQMEAFTNRESINLTMDIFNAWNLKNNNFLKDLQQVNVPVLRKLGLLPLVVRILNPATQGVAIERANTYTYKTKDYMLSTAQAYHPGCFGDQQHLWQATMDGPVPVFSTHPGSPMFDDDARNFSPSYWVGNGINPHLFQHENKLFMIYDLTPRKGYLERNRMSFIHFYIPVKSFDETVRKTDKLFIRKNDAYLGLLSSQPYDIKDHHDLIIYGKHIQCVVIMGRKKVDGSFESFIQSVERARVHFTKNSVTYEDDHHYALTYNKHFRFDQHIILPDHPRLSSPYGMIERKPEEIHITYQNRSLRLNIETMIREETHDERQP